MSAECPHWASASLYTPLRVPIYITGLFRPWQEIPSETKIVPEGCPLCPALALQLVWQDAASTAIKGTVHSITRM